MAVLIVTPGLVESDGSTDRLIVTPGLVESECSTDRDTRTGGE